MNMNFKSKEYPALLTALLKVESVSPRSPYPSHPFSVASGGVVPARKDVPPISSRDSGCTFLQGPLHPQGLWRRRTLTATIT